MKSLLAYVMIFALISNAVAGPITAGICYAGN